MLHTQDAVFNSVFSGERQPYSPADFLYSWWTVADHLAEYQQQVKIEGCVHTHFTVTCTCDAWHVKCAI